VTVDDAKDVAMAADTGPAIGISRAASRVDRWLGLAIEFVCAVLLIFEIVMLLINVVGRYVFHAPQVWIDELSMVLFLWLTMLGAVLALRASSHMRMTAVLNRTSGRTRRSLDALTGLAILVFLALLLMPAVAYVQNESSITFASWDVSLGWRAAAMPAGIALMLLSTALRMTVRPGWFELGVIGIALVLLVVLYLLAPLLRALGNINLLIFFVGGVGAMVFAGIPIAFSFGLATLGYLALATHIPVSILASRMDAGMTSPVLLAIPLFVFLGLLIELAGMAKVMVGFLANLFGHIRGGLSYVLIVSIYLVSGISGSKAADMAAIAPVLFPEMIKRGVPRGDLVALLAATGAQTETIPPSFILITIGSVTGMSIASLFAGGVLPGIVGGFFLSFVVWWRARHGEVQVLPRATAAATVRSLVVALPALVLPFVIRSAIVEGVATATEVSTIGIAYSLIAGALIYRVPNWRPIWPMLIQTATLSGAILLIVGAATSIAWAVTQTGLSHSLAIWVTGLPGGAISFLAISIVIFIVLGSVLEGIPAIVLMGPLLFPVARQVGLNEIHYAMVCILAMGVGLFSPPIGVGYYVASAIGGATPDEGLPHIGRYILALLAGLLVVTAVPWISTVLAY
jgi:tripartite ATP-independent transporter DctM subunit